MSGFRDEAQLWDYMHPRMMGKWTRVECIMPEGFPDVMGSYNRKLVFIERKIGMPDRKLLEPGQIEFIEWMEFCDRECYVAFGDPNKKKIRWCRGLSLGEHALVWPDFWRGRLTGK